MMDNDTLLKVNNELVTLGDLAQAWTEKAERFTDAPWTSPASNLPVGDYAKVSLIDLNEPGAEKVKGKIKLPIRSTPGGAINRNALRAAAAALGGARGGLNAPAEAKAKAARTLVRLMKAAGIVVGDGLLRMAGMSTKAIQKNWSAELVRKDDAKQVGYYVVLQPDVHDLQGDAIDKSDIEDSAHDFLVQSRKLDYQHERLARDDEVSLVESSIMLTDVEVNDRTIKGGSWVVAVKYHDPELWEQARTGKIGGVSITGRGLRRELEPAESHEDAV